MELACPLCSKKNLISESRFPIGPLVDLYRKYWNTSISDASFIGGSAPKFLEFFRCRDCGLGFYDPSLVGTGDFYNQLTQHPRYYSPVRWEFDTILNWIPNGCDLLEIGSGDGSFLKQIKETKNPRSLHGLELSEPSVEKCLNQGLSVEIKTLQEYGAQVVRPQHNLVLALQVLEHVVSPGLFLRQCLSLLVPGGYLILSVPNADGFLKLTVNDITRVRFNS